MKFTPSFLAFLAVSQSASAFPFGAADDAKIMAPVPVTRLTCDGNTFQCTANLDFGDGRWAALWGAAVYHTNLFGTPDHTGALAAMTMEPVPVTKVVCDGNSYECTANLNFGDGHWIAQWSANVFHSGLRSGNGHARALAPVPVTKLTCDGDSYMCTANLDFGDGLWVAQWESHVLHTSAVSGGFLSQK